MIKIYKMILKIWLKIIIMKMKSKRIIMIKIMYKMKNKRIMKIIIMKMNNKIIIIMIKIMYKIIFKIIIIMKKIEKSTINNSKTI